MLHINYRNADQTAVVHWDQTTQGVSWIDSIRRVLLDASDSANLESSNTVTLPWWNFIATREQFLAVCRNAGLKLNLDLLIGTEAQELLLQSRRSTEGYAISLHAAHVAPPTLLAKLQSVGFTRTLTDRQVENVGRIAALPAGATFSVPGAGKTTEALATFFYRSQENNGLLVIAPKNAFAAWDEQIKECVPHINAQFCRLKGGREKIAALLAGKPRFMIVGYQQLARIPDLISAYLAEHKTFVFLDESHRIKAGTDRITARSVLNLSHLPAGKLIMSGTPMPQDIEDLVPQFAFLYPEIPANRENVIDLMKPIYVRTNKAQLGLPDVTRKLIPLEMAPLQHELYKLMKLEVAREAIKALSIRNKQAFRNLGRSVARVLQFVSNPALLSSEFGFAHSDLLSAVLSEGDGPKLKYVLKRARALANEGQKVLIWSSYVKNVEYIAQRLSDHGAVYIHGGVDAGDEDDDETREGKIKLFHDSANVRILVANPAAASEGISLHRVCHHAIYLDRTFNAAHYLQSEDRIHRYGLKPGQKTDIEIVQCVGTVDETVELRLRHKIELMSKALEDSSLSPEPLKMEAEDIENYDEYSTGLSQDDIQALLNDLGAMC